MKDLRFTDRELDVMDALWKLDSGTVTEVREHMDADLAYTSVLKVLQILEEKGHVRHEAEGQAYRYFPTVQRAEAGRSALRRVVDRIFEGSAELTLAHLVETTPIPKRELKEMMQILKELEAQEAAAGSREEEETEDEP
jgi:predicted transcriptional regulator